MPRARVKTQIPGAAKTDPESKRPVEVMHPAVARAMESAEKMSYAEAEVAAREGRLANRVLTERGWFVPNADRPVE